MTGNDRVSPPAREDLSEDTEVNHRNLIVVAGLLLLCACGDGSPGPAPAAPPYAVGSATFFIHDESRGYDSVNGIDDGIRTLITEIWYPAEHRLVASGEYRRATYGDYVFGDREMHRLMMTGTTFFHLTPDTVRDGVTQDEIDAAIRELFERERGSYVDAPLAHTGRALPVVVVSHGDAGSRYNMESVAEYLAAHGYFVIAPEHTGNSPYSLTGRDPAWQNDPAFAAKMAGVLPHLSELGAYGDEAHYGQSYTPLSAGRDSLEFLQRLDRSLLQRLDDLRAALAELERMNAEGVAGSGPGALDLERIGLTGRSFGGATTLVGLGMEPRFTSGFAVVPPGWPDPRAQLPAEALAGESDESVLLSSGGEFPLTVLGKPTLLLSGSEDTLIIGLAASSAEAAGVEPPSPGNPHPLLRRAFETADSPVVWAMLADSNHSTFGVSGGYWWPELKPNTQARHFDPDTVFELADVAKAHRMQRELALDFFDATLRADASAVTRLRTNRYAADGLTLETRNF